MLPPDRLGGGPFCSRRAGRAWVTSKVTFAPPGRRRAPRVSSSGAHRAGPAAQPAGNSSISFSVTRPGFSGVPSEDAGAPLIQTVMNL